MKQYASMNIQFSRGCPFNCDFCNVTALFGHKPRIKTSQQVIAELDRIYASGWRSSIFFVEAFKSAFRLGVLGKERFQYWRLMLWAMIYRPRLIPVAITLSIYGYHYRKICELYIFEGGANIEEGLYSDS